MSERQLSLHTVPGLWPPSWPMGLTMLRLLLLPVFLYLLLADANTSDHSLRWWAVAVFAIMAITDKLDGYLARKLNQTSKIGTILDPVADKLLIACSVMLLSFAWAAPLGWNIPVAVVAIVYGKDLIVAIGSVALLYLAGRVTITPRLLGKATTFLQLCMVMATLLAPDLVRLFGEQTGRGIVVGTRWLVAVITGAACGDYVALGFRQLAASRVTATAQVATNH